MQSHPYPDRNTPRPSPTTAKERSAASYRVYIIDGEDRILIGSSARCASDDEACAAARRMLRNDARAEVWLGTRLVREIPAQAPAADGD